MMYYKLQTALFQGGVLDSKNEDWIEDIKKQLCWTKGTRHRVTHKKMAEAKQDIKDRVGKSPDIADGAVLLFAHEIIDRLPQNEVGADGTAFSVGEETFKMPDHNIEDIYGDDDDLYD